jgi:hypothetical protein
MQQAHLGTEIVSLPLEFETTHHVDDRYFRALRTVARTA